MRRLSVSMLAAAGLLAASSLPAHADPGDAMERMLDGGAVESLVGRALSGIDFDALLAGLEHSTEAATQGRAPDPRVIGQAQARLEGQMAQTGPALARDAASVLLPLLRELRLELGRELPALPQRP